MNIPIGSKFLFTPTHHLHILHAFTHTNFPLMFESFYHCILVDFVIVFNPKMTKGIGEKLKCIIKYAFIPKEPWMLREHNLNFERLCKLEKWSNEAEILVCGGWP